MWAVPSPTSMIGAGYVADHVYYAGETDSSLMDMGGPVYSLTRPNTRPWAVDGVMRGALVMSSPAWACAPVASVNLSKGAVEAPAMSQAMTMIPVLLATLKEMVRSLPGVALTAYQTCGLSR